MESKMKEEEKSALNEYNLNCLHEEASNYQSDEDMNENCISPIAPAYKAVSTSISNNYLSTDENKKMHQALSNNNLDYDKSSKNVTVNSKSNEKDSLIATLQRNLKKLQSELSFKAQNIQEIENENNLLKIECMKLQEAIVTKDNIINEFQHLAEVSQKKFQMFEDANGTLISENEKLNQMVSEYDKKLSQMKHRENLHENIFQNTQNSLKIHEQKLIELQNELSRREGKYKTQLSETEEKIKVKYKEREEKMKAEYFKEITDLNKSREAYRLSNEKLKLELRNMKSKTEDYASVYDEKENNLKIALLNKEKEIEKQCKQLKEIQLEINEFEQKNKDMQNDFYTKVKCYEENEQKLFNQLEVKDKRIKECEEEIDYYKNILIENHNELKEWEIKCENKDKIIEQIKNQNTEIMKDYNTKEKEYSQYEEAKSQEIAQLVEHIEEITKEKNEILAQNLELQENLEQASENLRKMNELIADKYQHLEMNLNKEINNKEYLEKKYKNVIRKMKEKERQLVEEVNSLTELLNEKDLEREQMKYKYESELKNLKYTMAENTLRNRNFSAYEDPNEEKQKMTLDNFKKILNQIDEKIDFSKDNFAIHDTNNLFYSQEKR